MSSMWEECSSAQPQAFSFPSSFDSEATVLGMQAVGIAAPTPCDRVSSRSGSLTRW